MTKFVLALLCAGVGLAEAGIDLTPRVTQTTTPSGIPSQHFAFSENGRPITYVPPTGWNHSGGGASLKFTPPGLTQARAEIDQVPLAAPQNFDDEITKALRDKVVAEVPPDSRNVSVTSETLNPLRVNGNQTYEVIVSYNAFGHDFMTGVIYLNLPDTQLRFRTTARKADFEKVHNAFRASMFTWQWQ